MFSSHTKVGPERDSTRPAMTERTTRTWYGRRRRQLPRKPTPKGGYDLYRGYDAPEQQEVREAPARRPTVDLALTAFVLGLVALLLSFIPVIRYVGAVFALAAVVTAVRELATHDPGARIQYKGAAARSERFARLGRFFAILALAVVVATTLWGVKEGADDRAKERPGSTGKVLDDDLNVEFGPFTREVDAAGVETMGVEVTLKNKSGERRSFDVVVEGLNADGQRIDSHRLLEHNLIPSEERTVSAFTAVDDATAEALEDATFRVATATSAR